MHKLRWALPAFGVWMAVITVSCLIRFPELGTPGISIPHADKVVHFGIYALAGVLGILAVRERLAPAWRLNPALVRVFLALFAFGAGIELLQALLPTGRSAEWADALANGCGLLVSLASMKGVFHEVKALNWPE